MSGILPWQLEAYEHVEELLARQRLPHAMLLSGPAHCGLNALGEALAVLLLCRQGSACGDCQSCRLQSAGSHPDFLRLQPEEESAVIKIDAVRALIHQMTLTASIAPRKVALITPAEAMNINAANALLKTLEEPPGQTVLILISYKPQHLLATIRSRCRALPAPAPSATVAMEWLQQQSAAGERDQLEEAMTAAGGLPFLAQRYLADGDLQKRRRVAADLKILAQGRGQSLTAVKRWSEVPAGSLWQWLADWSGALARLRITGAEPQDPLVRDLASSQTQSSRQLLELQRQAMQALRLMDTTLRQDLLLAEWLLQWQGSTSGEHRRAG